MALKYNPTRDPEPPRSSPLWPIVCTLLVACVGYFAYQLNHQPTPSPPVVVAEATPTPEPVPTPVPTPAPRLAPEGTFFVLNYITVRTKSGVIGFEPGREVHLVKALREQRKLLVSDGQYQTEVDPSQLTNDLDVADLARAQDAASQNQLAAFQAAERTRYEQSRHEADLAHSKDVAQMNNRLATGNAIGSNSNPLNKGAEATHSFVYPRTYYGNPYSYFY